MTMRDMYESGLARAVTMGAAVMLAAAPATAGTREVNYGAGLVVPIQPGEAPDLSNHVRVNVAAGIAVRADSYDADADSPARSATNNLEFEYAVDIVAATDDGQHFPIVGYDVDIWMTPKETLNDPRDDMRVNPHGQQMSKRYNAPTYAAGVEITVADSEIFGRMYEHGTQLMFSDMKGKPYMTEGDFTVYTQGTVYLATAEGVRAVRIPGLEAGTREVPAVGGSGPATTKANYSFDEVNITGLGLQGIVRYPWAIEQWASKPLVVRAARHKAVGAGNSKEVELQPGMAYEILDNSVFEIVGTPGIDELTLCKPEDVPMPGGAGGATHNPCAETRGFLREEYVLKGVTVNISEPSGPIWDYGTEGKLDRGEKLLITAPVSNTDTTRVPADVPIVVDHLYQDRHRRSAVVTAETQDRSVHPISGTVHMETGTNSQGHAHDNQWTLERRLVVTLPVDTDHDGVADAVEERLLATQSWEVQIDKRPPFQWGTFILGYAAGVGTGLLIPTGEGGPMDPGNPGGGNNTGGGGYNGGGSSVE